MTLNKINKASIVILLFSPLLSFLLVNYFDWPSATVYFRLFISVYGTFFVASLLSSRSRVVVPSFCWALLLYSIYAMLWSVVNGEIQRRGVAKVFLHNVNIQMFIMFILIYNTKFSERFINICIRISTVTVVVAFIVSVYQVYNPAFMNYGLVKYGSWRSLSGLYNVRRASVFGYTHDLEISMSFLPLLSVLVSWMIANRKRYYLGILFMGGVSSILTNTRHIMISFLLILLMIVNHYRHHIVKRTRSILVGLVVIVMMLGAVSRLGYDFSEFYEERLFSEGSIDQTTRFLAFQTFSAYFGDHALFGTGIRTFNDDEVYRLNAGQSSQIHVGYLDHLVMYGIVGSILMFTFWLMIIVKLRKTALRTGYWGSLYAFLIFLVANATLVNYSLFFYGLIFAFVFDRFHSSSLVKTAEVPTPLQTFMPSNPSI